MKNITKMIMGLVFLCLLIGSVSAFDVDSLTPLEGYGEFQNGCSTFTTNGFRHIWVEKMQGDYKSDWFTNSSDITVFAVNDSVYRVESDVFEYYGYQEIVTMDDGDYMISVVQDSKMSPSEVNLYLKDLEDFNKLNNLTPIAI